MKTLKDVLNGTNIFSRYKELFNDDFISLYGDLSENEIVLLNNQFISLYGNRLINNLLDYFSTENNTIDLIVNHLHYSTISKLLKIKELLNIQYNALDSYKEKLTETIENTGSIENTSNNENIDSVYGYNSENAVKENQSNFTDTNNTLNTSSSVKTTEKTITNKEPYIIIDNEVQREVKNNFVLLTLETYRDILTISIYE